MYVLKMMSAEDLADSCSSKGFSLVPVPVGGSTVFERNEAGDPVVRVIGSDGMQDIYYPQGNVYTLQDGRTIATFARHLPLKFDK